MENRIITEIKAFMAQADLTDLDKISALVSDFSKLVEEYNRKCDELRQLKKNGMLEEVERALNEMDPPLQEQYNSLHAKKNAAANFGKCLRRIARARAATD